MSQSQVCAKGCAVIRVGVDVGGTFTDLVALDRGRVVTAKVPSTPEDQSEGVMRSLEAVEAGDVAAFAHGMTVATNALLERRGARTALVTTEGFRDLIELARQDRPALYDLAERRPEPLVPRDLRFTVRERMGPDGEVEPLDEDSLRDAVERLRDADVEAVAVCLLFAFLHPEHEARRVGEAVREALGDVHVSLSSEVLPEFREYERFSTTVADAYLAPKLAAYLERAEKSWRNTTVMSPIARAIWMRWTPTLDAAAGRHQLTSPCRQLVAEEAVLFIWPAIAAGSAWRGDAVALGPGAGKVRLGGGTSERIPVPLLVILRGVARLGATTAFRSTF